MRPRACKIFNSLKIIHLLIYLLWIRLAEKNKYTVKKKNKRDVMGSWNDKNMWNKDRSPFKADSGCLLIAKIESAARRSDTAVTMATGSFIDFNKQHGDNGGR